MRFLPFWSYPLDWVQVEITTHCNASCVYCPRTVYRNSWRDLHLPIEAFFKLGPLFSKTRHLHLQGWGEPLLHPDFFQWVALAKRERLRVSSTTNGLLVDREVAHRLVESGLDLLAFSLAGSREETHDRIRKGTRWSRVVEALRMLREAKRERRSEKPFIHIAYMAFTSYWEEMKDLPGLLAGLDVHQVVISTLDFIPTAELRSEAFRPSPGKERGSLRAEALLQTVRREGQKKGITVVYSLPPPDPEGKGCTENPLRAFCVASDGEITPCVYTNLQVKDVSHFNLLKERPYERMGFGNLFSQSPLYIWDSQPFRAFRRSFGERKPFPVCRGCPKLR